MDIRLQDITKVYPSPGGAAMAVDGITLRIASGEFFFLLGPSGCGKTTLLRIIAGLVARRPGRVFFGGDDVTDMSVEKRRTAMVFQNYALWPHMTVRQNVEFGPRMRGVAGDERAAIASDNLARVEMGDYAARKPAQLSGGQQQRVALARALAAQGKCLLLDEPLSNLDARLRLHMRGQLRQLVKSTGATAVYVTHDQKEALSMADRIAVMDAGKIVQVGPPAEIYSRPASRFVADFLGEANFAPGKITTADGQPCAISSVGTFRAADAKSHAAGAAVTVCIRPERIRISADDPHLACRPTDGCCIGATVASTMYLGELRQYSCRLDDGTVWKVYVLAEAGLPFQEGQRVRLAADVDDVILLTS